MSHKSAYNILNIPGENIVISTKVKVTDAFKALFLRKNAGFFTKTFCPVIAKCSSARNNEYYIINKPIYADDARTNRILISDLSRSHRYLL